MAHKGQPCSNIYRWLSLSQPRLSRINAYLEVKIWSLPKQEYLTTGKKYCGKEEKFSPLFHNIFNISLTSRVQLLTYLLNVVVRIIFSSILQPWYVEVRISRSISESPLEFEITRVDCICIMWISPSKALKNSSEDFFSLFMNWKQDASRCISSKKCVQMCVYYKIQILRS